MTDDPGDLLHTPVGARGSGRVRYGAAMARFQAGHLTEAQLEVYRTASADDACDPVSLLAERGLPPPPQTAPDGRAALTVLVTEVDRYLASLAGDGPVDVRRGMARWSATATPNVAAAHAVVDTHLPAALAPLSVTHPALAQAIATASRHLAWISYDRYPRDRIGDDFATGHAFASLIGKDAPIRAQDFDLGLFVIGPHVLYRDHHHAAPELYAPLTGPHGWRFAPDAPLVIKQAHVPVWNPPNRAHLTKVGPVPFLCIYAWTRDADALAHVIEANDWPELEALRL